MQIKISLILLILLVFIVACDNTPKEKEISSSPPTAKVEFTNTPSPETNTNLDLEELSEPQLELSVWKKDVNGKPVKTSPTQAFRSGDAIKVTVKANRDGYFYLLLDGSSGSKKSLYPDSRINGGINKIKADKEISIPASGWFVFDNKPGVETIYAVFTIKPEPELFKKLELITNIRKPSQKTNNSSSNKDEIASENTSISTGNNADSTNNDIQADNTNTNNNNATSNAELENEVLEQLQKTAKDINFIPDSQLVANKESNGSNVTNKKAKVKLVSENKQNQIVNILKLYHK